MTLYVPDGYANAKISIEQSEAKHRPGMEDGYAERIFDAIRSANGLVGIGNGWRSTATQAANYARDPKRFAPPGLSFHETQAWRDGQSGYAAVDTVGVDNRHGEAWAWMATYGPQFGLITFANVNNEPWHTQADDIPHSVTAWKNAGRPNPTPTAPPLPPPVPSPEEDMSNRVIYNDPAHIGTQCITDGIFLAWVADGHFANVLDESHMPTIVLVDTLGHSARDKFRGLIMASRTTTPVPYTLDPSDPRAAGGDQELFDLWNARKL